MADWANLPPFLMERLSSQLAIQDKASCLAVCRGWRSLEGSLFGHVEAPQEYIAVYRAGRQTFARFDRERAPTTAEWCIWLAHAATRWPANCVRQLHLNLQNSWLKDPGHDGWDARCASPAAAAALLGVLRAVLPRHAGSLRELSLGDSGGGASGVRAPGPEDLKTLAGLLRRHASQLSRLQRLSLSGNFACEELLSAAWLGSLPGVTRLEFLPPPDVFCPPDFEEVEGLTFPLALRSVHVNWVRSLPRALGQCSQLEDLEIQFRFPPRAAKRLDDLRDLLAANEVPADQIEERLASMPEENAAKLGLIEARELRPLAQLTQLTSLCMSGDLRRCPAVFSALAQLKDLHFSTARKFDDEEAALLPLSCLSQLTKLYISPGPNSSMGPRAAAGLTAALPSLPRLQDLSVYSCGSAALPPGPWQEQLTRLQAAWRQLAPDAEDASEAFVHLTALQSLVVLGNGRKRPLTSAHGAALLAGVAACCPALGSFEYTARDVRWAEGEEAAALEALRGALPDVKLPNAQAVPPAPMPGQDVQPAAEEEMDSDSSEGEGERDYDSDESTGPACCVM